MADNLNEINKTDKIIPLRLNFVKKRDVDRSSWYNLDGPFQIIHADISSLQILGKSVTHPKYCLVAVDVYSSKIYKYSMRQRELLAKKLYYFMTMFP